MNLHICHFLPKAHLSPCIYTISPSDSADRWSHEKTTHTMFINKGFSEYFFFYEKDDPKTVDVGILSHTYPGVLTLYTFCKWDK